MPSNTKRTRFPSVYARECKRLHNGRPDICFYFTVTEAGEDGQSRKAWIKAGLRSEGMTAAVAAEMRTAYNVEKRLGRQAPLLPGRKSQGAIRETARGTAGQRDGSLTGHGAGRQGSAGIAQGIRARQDLTFDDARAFWLEHVAVSTGSAKTYRSSSKMLDALRGLPLEEVTFRRACELRDSLIARGYSPASVKEAMILLQGIFGLTAKYGLHSLPCPTLGVELPRVDNQRLRFLTHEEANALLAEMGRRSPVWRDVAAISLWTGGRLREITHMRAGDVDLEAGSVRVDGKGGVRMLTLNAAAKELLAARIAGKEREALVFANRKGKLLGTPNDMLSGICLMLGINKPGMPRNEKIVFHSFRHTFASWLAKEGVPLYVISQLMGHSSVAVTQRYAHLCPDAKKDAVELLSGYLMK